MASFSNQAKTEICAAVKKPADRRAFLTGVLLAARRFSAEEIALQTECEAFAALFPKLLQTVCTDPVYSTEYRTRTKKQPLRGFVISDRKVIAQLTDALEIDPQRRAAALEHVSGKAQAMLAAGCFVMGGSVTDPKGGYHLELALPDADFGSTLQKRLAEAETPIVMKITKRKNETVLYLKQNEQIGDALTYFGAPNATLTLIDHQVYKSFRSQTNRRTNCDLANIDKTIAAGAQQIADIRRIQQTIGLEELPVPLQEIARVRLAEPDANLRDLGAMCNPPISRSGVHHRLQRISEIAAKLEK